MIEQFVLVKQMTHQNTLILVKHMTHQIHLFSWNKWHIKYPCSCETNDISNTFVLVKQMTHQMHLFSWKKWLIIFHCSRKTNDTSNTLVLVKQMTHHNTLVLLKQIIHQNTFVLVKQIIIISDERLFLTHLVRHFLSSYIAITIRLLLKHGDPGDIFDIRSIKVQDLLF